MNHKQSKLENPARLAELSPKKTLRKIGLREGDVFCDIGAGSGIFTIAGAQLTSNQVFALEINEEFLKIIGEKARKENLINIKTMQVMGEHYDIEAATVDLAILVTVLHEIENKDGLLTELKRIIKDSGKLAVIDFHQEQTPMGPPPAHRISKDEVIALGAAYGFSRSDAFNLGDNFYCVVFDV